MKIFVIDQEKCNGCYNCYIACKDEHVGNDWMPYAKPQPNTGQFWMNISETTHGQTPKVNVEYLPMPCMHCEDAACMKAAEEGAVYRRTDGLVIIDPEKAVGIKEVVDACPYGAAYWNEELNVAQKCTGCAHLIDAGEAPHCVDLCTTGALRFGDYEDFADELVDAEQIKPEHGPHVYYLNRPGLFVAGDVWDPGIDRCTQDAIVRLAKAGTGEVWTAQTDNYGDFWFEKLAAGEYSVTITKDGYLPVNVSFILDKSLNLGDFPLKRSL